MSNHIDARIEAKVSEFVAELSALDRKAALDSLNQALGGNVAARRGPGRPRGTVVASAGRRRGRPGKGQKRTGAELEALTAQLLAAIKKAPGNRIEQVGAAMGVPTKELALPIRKLLADGAIRKKGQKRATAYFAK